MNLVQIAEESAERLGEHPSIWFEDRVVTNWTMLEQGRRLAAGFAALGLGAGDKAVFCLLNDPLIYSAIQGVFRCRAAAVPVMAQAAAPELRYVLTDTQAALVITDAAQLAKVRAAVAGLDFVRAIAVVGGQPDRAAAPPELALEDLLEHEPAAATPAIEESELAVMLYTSGTTGRPKGVMLSHGNLSAAAETIVDAAALDAWETPRITVSSMPIAHIFGIAIMNDLYLTPPRLAQGSYLVQMRWFDAERLMQLVQQHRATTLAAVPTLLTMLLTHPREAEFDLTSLREVICGAAPLPVELARAFSDRYGCRVREVYGLTEACGLGTANRIDEPFRPGSAGRAYKGGKIAILDDDHRHLPVGEPGEICISGPYVMQGYYNRPEETARAIHGEWLHTGDIGYLDDDGYLFVVDRKKDMIIRGGENIYPAELEDILYRHAGVAEAAVVGAPDPVFGEQVVAFVVRRAGHAPSAEELIAHVESQIARFKAPSRVVFAESLPKGPIGKILRRELRERAAQVCVQ